MNNGAINIIDMDHQKRENAHREKKYVGELNKEEEFSSSYLSESNGQTSSSSEEIA